MADETSPFDRQLYDQLRQAAGRMMQQERRDHTLSATAVVHEVFLRLRRGSYPNAAAYFKAATTAMRRVLVDHARQKLADKRGGDARPVRWDDLPDALQLAAADRCEEILSLDEAISRLGGGSNNRAADVVRMKFFGGFSLAEIAEALDITERTVKRDWQFARAQLYRLLKDCNA
ncbi:MAG: ECF-type sigma factor [Planctomycetota bacterium]